MELSLFGWSDHFAQAFSRCEPALSPARVASETRGHYELWMVGGIRTARLPGAWKGPTPVTGDWVGFDADHVIRCLLPRRSKVSRKKAGRVFEEQALAANVDVLFLVTGLDRDFNVRRLERYLMMTNESGVSPVVILNKADLASDPIEAMRCVDAIAPGAPAVLMSALSESDVAQLHRYVEPGETAVLLGSSGAGKSTIVNRLLQAEVQRAQPVREWDSRGRHTTTGRQMFLLAQGWLLIDTPGLRELEPWAGEEAASAVFSDIAELARQCRFRDCLHRGEPGCAVARAIEEGVLDMARLGNFQKLRAGAERLERMQDIHAAHAEKRKWKQIHKAMRNYSKW